MQPGAGCLPPGAAESEGLTRGRGRRKGSGALGRGLTKLSNSGFEEKSGFSARTCKEKAKQRELRLLPSLGPAAHWPEGCNPEG